MNVLEPIFVSTFISTTFNCIKRRGIYAGYKAIVKALSNKEETKYYLKLDIKKFYPNIDNEILKSLLRRKFKDNDLLDLLNEIIDSTIGVPIGNYLSQYFANFYLTYFDHWVKEELKVKYYYRYCDDILIFHEDKEYLHKLLRELEEYLDTNLKLDVKNSWRIAPVDTGIDVLGFVFYPNYRLLRKSIKIKFIRMIKYNKNKKSIASYNGWLIHCSSKNLRKKYL
jgi:RNA-directed DNA polymerase